jgi:HEAT repeat protein
LLQLSEQSKTVKLPNVTCLMTIIAEFRPLIGPAIPEIVELLKHNGLEARKTAANTLLRLSEQGKTAKLFNAALLMTIIAEFRPLIATAIPEFVNLFKDSDWDVRWAGKNALSQLSKQRKMVKSSDVALLMTIIVEFRPFIGPAIPEIVKLLKHNGAEIRQTAAYTLLRLSEQGKIAKLSNVAMLMTTIAEYRPFIATAIPEILELLKDREWELCLAGVNALSHLSEHGKMVKLSDVALLMTAIAEFRPLIGPAIPEIIKLLKHTGWEVCRAGVDALLQLSEHGKMDNVLDVAFLMTLIAEFRPLIGPAIPEIIKLLKHTGWEVCRAGVDALLQLSEHGKMDNVSELAFLMTIMAEFRPLIGPAIPEIVKLLRHCSWVARRAGDALSQLSVRQSSYRMLLC